MAINQTAATRVSPIPPRQRPYEQALRLVFERLQRERPSEVKLRALGAVRQEGLIRMPALANFLLIDLDGQDVLVADGDSGARPMPVGHAWALVALHYLCAEELSVVSRAVSFSEFTDCLGYVSVFNKRVIGRFLATSGRTREQFEAASLCIGGKRMAAPGVAFAFKVLPRVPITVVWHAGDEELGAGANVIYQADAAHLLPAEDRIVAAELVIDALNGKQLAENGGTHA
ncbi:MAG: DUF3786 domain-containing protein [Kiritimatiellota bacterium]|nr:DUF3786 domain-containing protein [Kiritimatiellota bacterium]